MGFRKDKYLNYLKLIYIGYNFLIWLITAAAGILAISWDLHPYSQLIYITVRVTDMPGPILHMSLA
jgi:hypothetical protein